MKLNRTDYVLERASDGGYYVWLTVNMQCNACPYLDDDTGCEVCYISKAIEIFKNGIC